MKCSPMMTAKKKALGELIKKMRVAEAGSGDDDKKAVKKEAKAEKEPVGEEIAEKASPQGDADDEVKKEKKAFMKGRGPKANGGKSVAMFMAIGSKAPEAKKMKAKKG